MRTIASQRGSSLVEVLLVIAVMVMLAGASVISFSSQLQRSTLEEGVSRLQSMLRFARAEAANSGHKVQIQFASSHNSSNLVHASGMLLSPKIASELDPLNAPGVFSEMQDIAWMDDSISELVQVESVHSLDAVETGKNQDSQTEPESSELELAEESGDPLPITFYPDGSSDSVEIVLVSTDLDDARKIQLKLIGLTGSIEQNSLGEETPSSPVGSQESSAPCDISK